MYGVLDVCRFIINYCNDREYIISNLKLQKILYFVQAYFLTFTDNHQPCFEEKILAWDFGPVVPEAYREYKIFGSSNIPKVGSYIEINKNDIWNSCLLDFSPDVIDEEDRMIIEAVVDEFAPYSSTYLVDLTHHQAPWENAYKKGQNTEITKEAIRKYFSNEK